MSGAQPPHGEPSVRIEQVSLVDQAADKIRELILAGVIQPGAAVREEWLHEQLGISRPPIREAMQVLVQQGLLERLPRRGVRALELTQNDVWEIYSLRRVLDQYALRLGVPVKSEALLEPLRMAITAMRVSAEADDHGGYVEANRQFHLGLVALAGNRRLSSTYQTLMNQMQLLMSVNLSRESAKDREIGVHRHENLLAAIESGDLNQALAALEEHGESRFLVNEPPDAAVPDGAPLSPSTHRR
jgi:DNA-binding GntR family transcriptional regulator